MVAPQLLQAPCSSSSFSLACLAAVLSATKVTMAEHQVLSPPIQTMSLLFLFSCTRVVPSVLFSHYFYSLFIHFNLFCCEGAVYVEQYPHQELPEKHIVLEETVKVHISLSKRRS